MTKESLSIQLINETLFQQILNYLVTLSLYTFMFGRRGNGSLRRYHLYNDDKEQFISLVACFKQHSLLSLWKQSDLDSESLYSLEQKQSTFIRTD